MIKDIISGLPAVGKYLTYFQLISGVAKALAKVASAAAEGTESGSIDKTSEAINKVDGFFDHISDLLGIETPISQLDADATPEDELADALQQLDVYREECGCETCCCGADS